MKTARLLYLLIAILFIWNLVLSVILNQKQIDKPENVIVENTINGISSDLTKVVDKIEDSCLTIETTNSIASGFIYKVNDNKVYVISAYHVVEQSENITAILDNGITYPLQVVGYDIYADIAVLSFESDFVLNPVVLSDSANLKDGEFLISIGTSGIKELSSSISLSIVAKNSRFIANSITYEDKISEYFLETIQYSSTMTKGYSGGALFNMEGEVVGVNILSDGNNCFGLTSNELKVIADGIINDNQKTKVMLDVKGTYLSQMENYVKNNLGIDLELTSGFYVSLVRFNSLGFNLGLKSGDIIKSINNIEIKSSKDYYNAVYTDEDVISITIVRGNEELILEGSIND